MRPSGIGVKTGDPDIDDSNVDSLESSGHYLKALSSQKAFVRIDQNTLDRISPCPLAIQAAAAMQQRTTMIGRLFPG